jgi:hypothetical protein
MREGLYEIKFHTPIGEGRGLVALQNGQVLGGDAIIIYTGTFVVENDRFIANVRTARYAAELGMISVLGGTTRKLISPARSKATQSLGRASHQMHPV